MNEIQKMDALVFVTSEDCMREIATRTDALLAVKQVTNDAEARAADAAVKAWMESPNHKAAILNSGYRYMGVSTYVKNGVTYWAQLFSGSDTAK